MDTAKVITTLQTLFETYHIRCLAFDFHSVPSQLYAEAMNTRFVVPPFEGKPDWELLLLKLERWKNGNKKDIERMATCPISTKTGIR